MRGPEHAAKRQAAAREFARRGDFLGFCILIGFHPHAAQQAVIDSDAWVRVVRWGRRCGKTLLAGVEAAFMLLQADKRVWVVAPDHSLAGRVWEVIVRVLIDNLGFEPSSQRRSAPYYLAFPWGSACEGKSTEYGSRKSLVGAELDLLVWDEVAKSPPDIWESRLQPNLAGADHRGKALLISTPEGFNHFYDFCERGQQDPDWAEFHATSWANPHLDRGWLEEAERNYSPEHLAQEYKAEFQMFVGQVYKEFGQLREELCIPLPYDPNLPLYGAIDWGVTNPFAFLWIQTTGGDVVRVINEYYGVDKQLRSFGLSAPDSLDAVIAKHRACGYPMKPDGSPDFEWVVADRSEPGSIITANAKGFPCQPAIAYLGRGQHKSEIAAGVELGRRFLRERRAFFDKVNTPHIQREFGLYHYAETKADRTADEVPHDSHNHALGAWRYFLGNKYGVLFREEFADPQERPPDPMKLLQEREAQKRAERFAEYMAPGPYG